MNILKFLSHPSTGCNRKILFSLYKSPILDYGSPIYGLALKSSLILLDLVQTASLRITTAAFCTSPALSLGAETGIYPLHSCRLEFTANLLTKISLNPELLCHARLFEQIAKSHPTSASPSSS